MEMRTDVQIIGMHCDHCVAAVTDELEKLTGVQKVKVNLRKGIASIKHDDSVTDEDIDGAVRAAGFEVA
jgi:copper chaperone CopZ